MDLRTLRACGFEDFRFNSVNIMGCIFHQISPEAGGKFLLRS